MPSPALIEKRILICYASIGSGHQSAAFALQRALRESGCSQIELLDVFQGRRNSGLQEFLTALSTRFFPDVYNWSWRTGSLRWAFELSTRLPFLRERVIEKYHQFTPNLVICTHALPCAILAQHPSASPPRLIAVATDFQVHPYWPVDRIEAFVVASPLAAQTLLARGLAAEKIYRLGIPTNIPAVSQVRSNEDGKLHVLVIAGGRQIGPYLAVRSRVLNLMHSLKSNPVANTCWRFIFGMDQDLLRKAHQILDHKPDIEIFGYVDDMQHHYAWSNLIATKPGGLVLAEAFALGKPVVLLTPGVGQEAANAEVVQSAGAGILADSAIDFTVFLTSIHSRPEVLERLQLNTKALGDPDSALRTAQLAETLLQS